MTNILRSLLCFAFIRRNKPYEDTGKYAYIPQCDEKKPSCTNCQQHSIECDFADSASASPSSSASLSSRRYRFKQSTYKPALSPKDTGQRTTTVSSGVQCDLPVDYGSSSISMADLQLYHHYLTSTYKTLVYEPEDVHNVYQKHIPQWGFTFPSVLHLMLAISALHLGSEQPEHREHHFRQADEHFTFGVRSITSILTQLNSENCQMIYVSAVLICLVYFGHGPPPGEYLVFSETGKAEWLVLMRGVRSILESRRQEIFTGILEPVPGPRVDEIDPLLLDELEMHKRHILDVKQFIKLNVVDESTRDMCVAACTNLLSTFEEVYKTRTLGRDGICLMAPVIGWIYRLPESFVSLLEGKNAFALVVLAQWSILLRYMQSSWLMVGWDRHVVSGIHMSLRGEFHPWVEWPWSVIYA
ncbi:predicted protein [Aspergillus terreus NIH2624]|uniref:Zn(2)-C6 fungal-type domain-containing protein n=1 Tax=Aspergillus terreus (strain NIH 2624 / FGSC A1156) TaxID=341663 RepID=Q0CFG0_ASPTN|nr:uncharacterized protein ATEG_07574 [Aspergillus terreus NIH2624]EAU31836.1 predicted protein [Aspergillus terreus NIH2624]